MLRKKILLITYHFPPSAASGTFRILGFTRYLPTFGWQPLVVAPPTLPWEPIDPQLVEQVPDEAVVRHVPYSIGAPKLLRVLAQNAIWLPRAWSACKRLIQEQCPDLILTSGPPHCVHGLGHYLKRSTGLPWVADFRDPWISDGKIKKLGLMQRWALRWERSVFQNADLILANAPNACRMFQETYPLARDKVVTLTNGFDPILGQASLPASADRNVCPASVRILHAGEIYAGRDPRPLFEALANLNSATNADIPYRLQILGRNEIDLDALLRQKGWTDFVEVQGQRTYQESLDAMSDADLLVLFDSPGRTMGVPAKLYEYFRAGRPILALAESNGDVATILRDSGVLHRIASPKDTGQIRQALAEITQAMRSTYTKADAARLQQFTRENLTRAGMSVGRAHGPTDDYFAAPRWYADFRERKSFALDAGGRNMTRRLRVVHVTGCLDIGGQEKLLAEFAKHADRKCFDLRFVSLGSRGTLADELEAQGWPVTALDINAGLYLRLPWRLANLFRQWQIDIVHTHNERPLIYAAPAASLARVSRLIHTKHGRGTGNTPRQNFLTGLTARLTDRFVCVSDDCAKLAIEQGVSSKRVTTLHNGIDLQRFAFTGPCPTGPAVIVARLCPDKDLTTLLDAVALVIRDAADFRMTIAGDGPSMADLRQQADRLNLKNHVQFLGMVNDIPALLQQARMYVLSSISEGVSLTLLEAMACGLPIVATRVGGTPEVVTDGVTGLLVPPRDPKSLASAILRLHREEAESRRMGSAGRERVEQDFDVRRMVASYESLYLGSTPEKWTADPHHAWRRDTATDLSRRSA